MNSLQPNQKSPTTESNRTKSHRRSLLQKFKSRKNEPSDPRRVSSPTPSCSPLMPGVYASPSDTAISHDFDLLYRSIITHVKTYYSGPPSSISTKASRASISQATTGIAVPCTRIISLLGDDQMRQRALIMCIAWTVLSRSLLQKLGPSNYPGNTFLPPEIVECFQTFGLGTCQVNHALLSRWKQISASLMHSAYSKDTFIHFDSRTINIERAVNDLNPLLRTYATPAPVHYHNDKEKKKENEKEIQREWENARLSDLRKVLRSAANFAFMLFAQPCFWHFDWQNHSSPDECENTEFEFESVEKHGENADSASVTEDPGDLVIWPSLLRCMDGEGQKVEGDILSEKRYLDEESN